MNPFERLFNPIFSIPVVGLVAATALAWGVIAVVGFTIHHIRVMLSWVGIKYDRE